jgi:sec-independent protein translocase protein TatA
MLMNLPLLQSIFLFLNLGGGEVMLILLVVLLFFGSKSIPDLARGLGKGLREIREASENIRREIEQGAQNPVKEVDAILKDAQNTEDASVAVNKPEEEKSTSPENAASPQPHPTSALDQMPLD